MKHRLLALLVLLSLPLVAGTPVWSQPRPAGTTPSISVQAGPTVGVNTLTDEWSTTNNGLCSLREALQVVANSSMGNQGCGGAELSNFAEYTLALKPGTHLLSLPDELPHVTKKIVIDGKDAVVIDGGGQQGRTNGIFTVVSGELFLTKLKLQHGKRGVGGAIQMNSGDSFVRATEVEFLRNLADNGFGLGSGGAVAADGGSFVCVKSKFRENTARSAGGAIKSGSALVLIDRCEFFRNHAEINGGAYASLGGSSGSTTYPLIRNAKFRENFVYNSTPPANWPGQYQYGDDQSGGGAIYNLGFMEVEQSEFFKNYTQRSKGGGAIYNQGELRLLDVAFKENQAREDDKVPNTLGGAILNDSTLVARRSSIHHNKAVRGGAITNRTSGNLWLVNSTVAENNATKSDGGILNGYSFAANGAQVTDPGGVVHLWHSTAVRNKDSGASVNISNIGNGYFYMANSISDSPCTGTIHSHGGNVFKEFCQRQAPDINNDQTNTDFIALNVGEIELEGLTNNGGPNLPDAQFLSVKIGNQSKGVDIGRDAFCTDPSLQQLYLLPKDQIQGDRPNGTKCDAGAMEAGSNPPKFKVEPEWQSIGVLQQGVNAAKETEFTLRNEGGGVISWSARFVENPQFIFSMVDPLTAEEVYERSGGLFKAQSTTLKVRCRADYFTDYSNQVATIRLTTDLPEQAETTLIVDCSFRPNTNDAVALLNRVPPKQALRGKAGQKHAAQAQIDNPGNQPLNTSISFKDASAQIWTFKPTGAAVVATAEGQSVAPQAEQFTVPPGGSLVLEVACTPTELGLFVNTFQIATNDPFAPLLNIDYSCEGVPPEVPEALGLATFTAGLANELMGLALSPDGKQLLAGQSDDNRLVNFGIANPATGVLNFQGFFSQPLMNGISGIRFSSDGRQVYYSSSAGDGVVVANRAPSGSLTHSQTITRTTTYLCRTTGGDSPMIEFCPIDGMNGALALDISPDDRHLYVSGLLDDSLTVLRRNTDTGRLFFTQKLTKTIEGLDILNGPYGVVVSPDGRNVYAVGYVSDTVVAFTRSDTGRLSYLVHYQDEVDGVTGLNGPIQLTLSPDGNFLYVASVLDDAIQIFRRNQQDGFLTPVEAVPVGDGPYAVAVSRDADGERLFVALRGGDSVQVLQRNRETGRLIALEGQGPLAMDGAINLALTADNRHLYVALYEGKGVQRVATTRHAPLLQNLSPASSTVGGPEFTLNVIGDRFYADSVVLWNDSPLATTFVHRGRLTAVVPAGLVATVGTANIKVRTAAPGGGDSAGQTFTVLAVDETPIPSVDSFEPPEVTFSGQPLDVVINGAGFTPQSQVLLNGSPVETTYISPNQLLAQLAADNLLEPGPLAITVENGVAAGAVAFQVQAEQRSTAVKFTVAEPNTPAQAAVEGFEPASVVAGSGEHWIKVRGYNFSNQADASSVAYWNGVARETAVQDAKTLLLHLAADDVAAAGQGQVTVRTPGVDPSAAKPYSILAPGTNPLPQVVSAFVDETDVTMIVSGEDFVSGAAVFFRGSERTTAFVNQYQVLAAIAPGEFAAGGVIQVRNPGPGGGFSNNFYQAATRYLLFMPLVAR